MIEYASGELKQKSALFEQLFERIDSLVDKAFMLKSSDPDGYIKVELCGMMQDSPSDLSKTTKIITEASFLKSIIDFSNFLSLPTCAIN